MAENLRFGGSPASRAAASAVGMIGARINGRVGCGGRNASLQKRSNNAAKNALCVKLATSINGTARSMSHACLRPSTALRSHAVIPSMTIPRCSSTLNARPLHSMSTSIAVMSSTREGSSAHGGACCFLADRTKVRISVTMAQSRASVAIEPASAGGEASCTNGYGNMAVASASPASVSTACRSSAA